jgi:UDP-GlcNAc:undecaprenyl-phosphate GlcNAc-1-phosphate transferase
MSTGLIKNLIFFPLLSAFLASVIVTPLVIYLYRRLGWVEDPQKTRRQKDTHTYPVPRGGGIPIYLSLLVTGVIFLPFDAQLKGIIAGITIMAIIGVADDRLNLNPYLRFILEFLAAGLVVISGIGIRFTTNPFGGVINLSPIIATIVALIWIVFLANIVNWAKGFDGQLPGVVVIAGITIALFSLRYSADITQWPVAILASITAGAYLGFLPYNFYPQKIMPGYGGGTLAGFMIAILTILSTSKILTGMVVLGVPLIDAVYSIIRRISIGKSPVWGDRGHLHHKILDEWKWGKRKAAVFYWLVTFFLGVLALSLNSRQKLYTIIMLAVIIGGLLLWFNFLKSYSSQSDQGKHLKT